MKILLWGTYDTGKPRIRILCDGLRAHGIEVIEIHQDVWEDIGDKSALRSLGKWLRPGLRLLAVYPGLIWRYLHAPAHDVVLISYPGQLDALILRPFAWLRRKPVALDWFISAYDTVIADRKLLSPRNPLAWMLWACEWLAVRSGDFVFMDTETHARRMERLFHLAAGALGYVWVGAEQQFFRTTAQGPARSDLLHLLFYGQFIPLHGIDTIIGAARITRNEPIRWTLIGRGQESNRIRGMLEKEPLSNVEWIDWVPYHELPQRIVEADLCLGIFGTSDKAASVIPNKAFQIIASGKPLVTRDSAAIRELLANEPPCTRLVRAGDASSLVEAIHEHMQTAQARHAGRCHTEMRHRIDPPAIGRQLQALIEHHLLKPENQQ